MSPAHPQKVQPPRTVMVVEDRGPSGPLNSITVDCWLRKVEHLCFLQIHQGFNESVHTLLPTWSSLDFHPAYKARIKTRVREVVEVHSTIVTLQSSAFSNNLCH